MKPLIIFKGKTERSIQKLNLDQSYNITYQQNTWCSEIEFIEYISQLPKNKKILLFSDNFRAHQTKTVLDL